MNDKKRSMEEVTERLGVTARTLHYYEEIGLLRNVERTSGGHRLYSEEVIVEMEHILRLKNVLGCTLQEIRSIMDADEQLATIRQSYQQETSDVNRTGLLDEASALLNRQIRLIEEKIAGMQEMKARFQQRLDKVESIKSPVPNQESEVKRHE
ncbi:MerR family transcriptional regulator [Paenibacillus sp. sptzw28]|uniref:helix-turn-helix domain-containing protein n=1 Tax=Paenibacillus sp. sptzw28 TaxID=715179 RepID=UPI001C6EAB58|nr:MerR family transcriptional regulator [Paenibacillus sp. sptzw28]QYR21335.1 MerR family transcriptional regulator [Paenibacillus sp. sptzw28]